MIYHCQLIMISLSNNVNIEQLYFSCIGVYLKLLGLIRTLVVLIQAHV